MAEVNQKELGILILAAGASSRMGEPKQLLPWKDTTLLGHTINTAKKLSHNILVVLGAHCEQVKANVPFGIDSIVNPHWNKGMGTSISLGVAALDQTTKPKAILIVLIDQPLIDVPFLKKIIRAHDTHPENIIATSYGNSAGVPVLFPKGYFPALKLLAGNQGAKPLLKKEHLHVLTVNPGEVKTIDLDTLDSYQKFLKKHGS